MADSILNEVAKIDQERKKNPSQQPIVEATPVPSHQTEAERMQHAINRRQALGGQIDLSTDLARRKAEAEAALNAEKLRAASQTVVNKKDTGAVVTNALRSDISGAPVVESTMQKIMRFFRGK